ncbi:MAG TPA: hypothetical protein DCX32_01295 [Candidatus Moranbacteria bacterium]|nr:MAG: Transcriptional regulator, TraR/DksA family [Parcubacteria group bacterium GW2011_GWC1_45_14]HAV11161.1 hypothetical protein [Candidatus Moranbacteria bacterium]
MSKGLATQFSKPTTKTAITEEDRRIANLSNWDFSEHQRNVLKAMLRENPCTENLRKQAPGQIGTTKNADPVDVALEAGSKNAALLMLERGNAQCGEILRALRKIEEGTYLHCGHTDADDDTVGCGLEIGRLRLIKRPTATLCIECKTEQERAQKRP